MPRDPYAGFGPVLSQEQQVHFVIVLIGYALVLVGLLAFAGIALGHAHATAALVLTGLAVSVAGLATRHLAGSVNPIGSQEPRRR